MADDTTTSTQSRALTMVPAPKNLPVPGVFPAPALPATDGGGYFQPDGALTAPPSGPAPVSEDVAGRFLAIMDQEDPGGTAKLRREWSRADMRANLGYVDWMLSRYVPAEMLEDIEDKAALYHLGAVIARGIYWDLPQGSRRSGGGYAVPAHHHHGDPSMAQMQNELDDVKAQISAAQARGDNSKANELYVRSLEITGRMQNPGPATVPPSDQPPSAASLSLREQWSAHIDDLQRRTREAQANGDNRLANELYQQTLAAYTARDGNRPIVGAGGRTA